MIEQKNETAESVISYGIGCGTAFLGWVCEVTDLIQAVAVLFGCGVVIVRFTHDFVRLVRFIRNG